MKLIIAAVALALIFESCYGIVPIGGTCSTDKDCNGGSKGTQKVCSNAKKCITPYCHSNTDCPSSYYCGSTYQCTKALVYPLFSGSLDYESHNFGGQRHKKDGSPRCHAGCDLITKSPYKARAIADGTITTVMYGFTSCSGGEAGAVLIYHPHLDMTINYGEISSTYLSNNKNTIKAGVTVRRGDYLGPASPCGMLHFETYTGKRTSNIQWTPPRDFKTKTENCVNFAMKTKPAALMNCDQWIANHRSELITTRSIDSNSTIDEQQQHHDVVIMETESVDMDFTEEEKSQPNSASVLSVSLTSVLMLLALLF